MPQVVIDRALLLLIGVLRPAVPPFQELIAANLILLPPVAERVTVRIAELRYGVGRAAAEPANISIAFFLCSALYIPMVLLVLFWSRISTAVPNVGFMVDEYSC